MAVSGRLVRSEGAKFILFPWAFAMIGSCAATKMFSGSVRDAGNGLLVSGINQAQLDPSTVQYSTVLSSTPAPCHNQ